MLSISVAFIEEKSMIFVILGSQKFQFNRLLKKLDELVEDGVIQEDVFAQIGYSDYEPKNYAYKAFLNRDEFSEAQEKADIVITHGGTGAIIGAVKKGKKVLAVPRLAQYGEHVDDHQIQLLEQFEDLNLICVCEDIQVLDRAYLKIQGKSFAEYHSNTSVILDSIESYLSGILEK